MKYNTIIFEKKNNVAFIKLNRPHDYNSLNAEMASELLDISFKCDSDKSIRSVVLTGEGTKVFCSGGDLKSFYKEGDNLAKHLKMSETFIEASTKYTDFRQLSGIQFQQNSVERSTKSSRLKRNFSRTVNVTKV